MTPEHTKKKKSWNRGRTGVYSEATILKMRASAMGNKRSVGMIPWNKGTKGLTVVSEKTDKQAEKGCSALKILCLVNPFQRNEKELPVKDIAERGTTIGMVGWSLERKKMTAEVLHMAVGASKSGYGIISYVR